MSKNIIYVLGGIVLLITVGALVLRPTKPAPEPVAADNDPPAPIAASTTQEAVAPKPTVQETPPSKPSGSASIKLAPSAPTPAPQPVVSAYCSMQADCAGFKIRIEFQEDANCDTSGPDFPCEYREMVGAQEKHIYYITVRGDTLDGEVDFRNPNSGAETYWEGLLGSYNTQTGELSFWWGYYVYPNIMKEWVSLKTTGTISGTQFAGNSNSRTHVGGTVTYLPISASDKIPKKTCPIKGDKSSDSGYVATYYLATSVAYSKIGNPRDWFCSESDATAAGYMKSLQ